MAQPGFIFGQGTPDTYESLQSKRRTAERLGLAAMRTPQNIGEGLSSLGQAIAYRRLMNQADAGDAAGRAAYDEKRGSVLGALMGGALGGSAPAFNPSPSMPVTPNPAGLDPSIIAAVDRVNPQGREAEIRAGLIERGMAPHIADGFLMNFKDESGLDPGINEAAPIVPGSRGGFGLAQWTGPRRVALEKFAAARGAAPSDANVQLDFLMTELQGPESRAARNIFAAPDAGSAAAAIAKDFLRPAPEHLERRVAEYTGMNPGASIPAIMEIMADPYAPQGDKMVLGALLEQQLAQMQPPDPMRALDMEYKRAQIDEMRAPKVADAPASVEEYEYAVQNGFQGSILDYETAKAKAGASNTTVDMGGGSAKQIFDAMDARAGMAQSSYSALTALNEAEAAVDQGIISGAGANQVLGLQKVGSLFGLDPQAIVNTETFAAAMAPVVAATLKATAGTANLSNADMEFAKKAAAGDITLDSGSIKRLLGVLRRANESVVTSYKARLDKVYPEDESGTYERERSIFGLGDIPVYTPPAARGAPAVGGDAGLTDDDLFRQYGITP
jgi:hypothetical protein